MLDCEHVSILTLAYISKHHQGYKLLQGYWEMNWILLQCLEKELYWRVKCVFIIMKMSCNTNCWKSDKILIPELCKNVLISTPSLQKSAFLCHIWIFVWAPTCQMCDVLHKRLIGLISWQVTYILLCCTASFSPTDQPLVSTAWRIILSDWHRISHLMKHIRWLHDQIILFAYCTEQCVLLLWCFSLLISCMFWQCQKKT